MVLTGAQEPTGVPYIQPIVERKSPQGGSRSGGGNRRGGSGKSGGYRGGNSRRGR